MSASEERFGTKMSWTFRFYTNVLVCSSSTRYNVILFLCSIDVSILGRKTSKKFRHSYYFSRTLLFSSAIFCIMVFHISYVLYYTVLDLFVTLFQYVWINSWSGHSMDWFRNVYDQISILLDVARIVWTIFLGIYWEMYDITVNLVWCTIICI